MTPFETEKLLLTLLKKYIMISVCRKFVSLLTDRWEKYTGFVIVHLIFYAKIFIALLSTHHIPPIDRYQIFFSFFQDAAPARLTLLQWAAQHPCTCMQHKVSSLEETHEVGRESDGGGGTGGWGQGGFNQNTLYTCTKCSSNKRCSCETEGCVLQRTYGMTTNSKKNYKAEMHSLDLEDLMGQGCPVVWKGW